ncbi:MAG: hypothetical protein ACOY0T_21780 [Myxococcota bacterium]
MNSLFSTLMGAGSYSFRRLGVVASSTGYAFIQKFRVTIQSGPSARDQLINDFAAYRPDMTPRNEVIGRLIPPPQSVGRVNGFTSTWATGHAYKYQSQPFAGDGSIVSLARTDPAFLIASLFSTMQNTVDFLDANNNKLSPREAADAMKAGTQLRARLGMASIIEISNFSVSEVDGNIVISLKAEATATHLFSGSVGWSIRVNTSTGAVSMDWGGKGKGPFILDFPNNYVAIVMFETMSEIFSKVMDTVKDMSPADRAALTSADMNRMVEDALAKTDKSVQAAHMILRMFDALSPALIASKNALEQLAASVVPKEVPGLADSIIASDGMPMIVQDDVNAVANLVSQADSGAIPPPPELAGQVPGQDYPEDDPAEVPESLPERESEGP